MDSSTNSLIGFPDEVEGPRCLHRSTFSRLERFRPGLHCPSVALEIPRLPREIGGHIQHSSPLDRYAAGEPRQIREQRNARVRELRERQLKHIVCDRRIDLDIRRTRCRLKHL
jgi:hypothetical protein